MKHSESYNELNPDDKIICDEIISLMPDRNISEIKELLSACRSELETRSFLIRQPEIQDHQS